MQLTNANIVANQLAIIERLRVHQRYVEDALRIARRSKQWARDRDIHCGTLLDTLIDAELAHWRHLFMWGLTLDDEERAKIKAQAYHRFLGEGMAIMHHVDEEGREPSSYYAAEEEELRRLCRETFLDYDEVVADVQAE